LIVPIFEYQCTKCNSVQEEMLSRSEHPEIKCVVCGSSTERIMSSPNHKYVGTGFYATDYGAKYFCKSEKDAELKKQGKPPLPGPTSTLDS